MSVEYFDRGIEVLLADRSSYQVARAKREYREICARLDAFFSNSPLTVNESQPQPNSDSNLEMIANSEVQTPS